MDYLEIPPNEFFHLMGEGFERGGRIRIYRLMDILRKRNERNSK